MTAPMHRREIEMPDRIKKLKLDKHGRPIPVFVQYIDDEPDFRIMSTKHLIDCIRFKLCWVCGEPLGRYMSFTIGPMCAINRISGEPPSHKDCSIYSARACPFLSRPAMVRRDRNMPVKGVVAGTMIPRNPGVGMVWTTKSYRLMRDGNKGYLFMIGEPVDVSWWRESRAATRAEILESMETGLPLLYAADDNDPQAKREIDALFQKALRLVPAA